MNKKNKVLWALEFCFLFLCFTTLGIHAEENDPTIADPQTVQISDESTVEEENTVENTESNLSDSSLTDDENEDSTLVCSNDPIMDGWNENKTQYYKNGEAVKDVQSIDGKYYYFDTETGILQKGIQNIILNDFAEKAYFSDTDGSMQYGRVTVDGVTYYFDLETGAMCYGFISLSNADEISNYYFDSEGKMYIGDFSLDNAYYVTDSTGKIISTSVNNINYLSQLDSQWSSTYIGSGTMGSTGCCPTTLTMIVNALLGTSYTPVDIATLLYNNGLMNTPEEDGTGADGVEFILNYFGLEWKGNLSYTDLSDCLAQGYMVAAGMDTGIFMPYYGSHEILVYGYNNGYTNVLDPYWTSHNQSYSISTIYEQKSVYPANVGAYGPLFAVRVSKTPSGYVNWVTREMMDNLAKDNISVLADGIYTIENAANNVYVLDVKGGSVEDGGNVHLYVSEGTTVQAWEISHDDKGYIIITNVNSGKALDVSSALAVEGQNVGQWSIHGGYNQKWIAVATEDGIKFVSALSRNYVLGLGSQSCYNGQNVQLNATKTNIAKSNYTKWKIKAYVDPRDELDNLADASRSVLADGTYTIKNAGNETLVLDVKGGSVEDGGNVHLYTAEGTTVQAWRISHDEKGYITITNVNSGMALDVSSALAVEGQNVGQWSIHGGDNQKWIAVSTEYGIQFVSALNINFVLGTGTDTCNNRQNVEITLSKAKTSSWIYQKFEDPKDELDSMADASRSVLADGTYIIKNAANETLVLDVKGGSVEDGGNVHLYTAEGTTVQAWRISHDEKGYITITNVNSGMALDVSSALAVEGQNVGQWSIHGGDNQKWIAVSTEYGIQFVSALNKNYVLGVGSDTCSNRQNVLLTTNDSKTSSWIYQKFEDPKDELDSMADASRSVLADGTYIIKNAGNETLVLDVKGGSVEDGGNVHLYTAEGTTVQAWQISHDEKGYIMITNVNSGMALDVSSALAVEGQNVGQWSIHGGDNQKWIAVSTEYGIQFVSALNKNYVLGVGSDTCSNRQNVLLTTNDSKTSSWIYQAYGDAKTELDSLADANRSVLADGTYIIKNAANETYVLDVKDGSEEDGGNVQIYVSTGQYEQGWQISHDEKGYITITNVNSGKVLDVSSALAVEGQNVGQWSIHGGDNQKWIAVSTEYGIQFVSALNKNYVLGIGSESCYSGENVQLTLSNSKYMNWKVTSFKDPRNDLDNLANSNIGVIEDGYYIIKNAADENYVLDVKGGSTIDGANVQLYTAEGTKVQAWKISHDEKGYITIENVNSGKVLDVASALAVDGQNVEQWSSHGGYNQKWIAVKEAGQIKLVSALNESYILGISSESCYNEQNVQLGVTNSSYQRWVFTEYTGPTERTITICLDPGHGGEDSGDASLDVQEKYLNYSIATYLKSYLEEYEVNVVMTHTLEENPSLSERAQIAKDNGAQVLISLHLNASGSHAAYGAEVYYPNTNYNYAVSIEGQTLAQNIQDQLVALGIYDRGIKTRNIEDGDDPGYDYEDGSRGDYYGIIRFSKKLGITGIIVEHCCKDNSSDYDAFLSSEEKLQALAKADCAGIVATYNLVSKRAKLDALAQENKDTISDGTYTIYSNSGSNLAITVYDKSITDGANLIVSEGQKLTSQEWIVSHDDVGYITIINVNSGMVLDVSSALAIEGQNVGQWSSHGGYNQKWIAVSTGTGIQLVSALNKNYVLSVVDSNVQINKEDNLTSQRWTFTELYNIMGTSEVTVAQLVSYFTKNGGTYDDFSKYYGTEYDHPLAEGGASTIEKFCQLYYDEAKAEGVKVEVAFAQAMLETGFLQFGGDVNPDQYNFAGLGATGNGVSGNIFADVKTGIRAQIQHLKCYASTDKLNNTCVDQRWYESLRGKAKYVEYLSIPNNPYGSGWAADSNYSTKLLSMIEAIKKC